MRVCSPQLVPTIVGIEAVGNIGEHIGKIYKCGNDNWGNVPVQVEC